MIEVEFGISPGRIGRSNLNHRPLNTMPPKKATAVHTIHETDSETESEPEVLRKADDEPCEGWVEGGFEYGELVEVIWGELELDVGSDEVKGRMIG